MRNTKKKIWIKIQIDAEWNSNELNSKKNLIKSLKNGIGFGMGSGDYRFKTTRKVILPKF